MATPPSYPTTTAIQSVSGLTRDSSVILSGTAKDYPGGSGMASVYVGNYVGNGTEYPIGSVPIAADGSWQYLLSDLPDGTYNFLVTALDNQGYGVNVLLSPAVVIDTTGPTLTAGKSVSGTTASRGIVFSGTVSDSAGVASVEIYDTNGSTWTDLGSATINGTTWQLTSGHLASGAHNFIAVAIDSLSNVSSASTGGTVNVVTNAAVANPSIQRIIGNIDGGVTLLGWASAGSTVTITDTSAGVTRPLGSATAGSDGSFSLTTHTKLSLSATNTFTATASTATGQSNDNLGLFQLSSAGNDTLSGTTGQSDVFATFLRTGKDTITEFETTRAVGAAHDVVNLSGTGYGSYAQVASHISGASSAVIQLDAMRSVTLLGVSAASLQASDFRFS